LNGTKKIECSFVVEGTTEKVSKIILTLHKIERGEHLSCKIFEHFAQQADPVIEFIQLGINPFKRQRHFGAKTSQSTFLLEKQLYPL
jgi:hypothetical protein